MDYKFIFCLLFALITSKREFLSLLDKENVDDDPASSCQAAESKDQCLNVENPLTDYQCCYRSLKVDDKSSNGCIDFYKNIKITINQKNIKHIIRRFMDIIYM